MKESDLMGASIVTTRKAVSFVTAIGLVVGFVSAMFVTAPSALADTVR